MELSLLLKQGGYALGAVHLSPVWKFLRTQDLVLSALPLCPSFPRDSRLDSAAQGTHEAAAGFEQGY